jgi:hypothetical protein
VSSYPNYYDKSTGNNIGSHKINIDDVDQNFRKIMNRDQMTRVEHQLTFEPAEVLGIDTKEDWNKYQQLPEDEQDKLLNYALTTKKQTKDFMIFSPHQPSEFAVDLSRLIARNKNMKNNKFLITLCTGIMQAIQSFIFLLCFKHRQSDSAHKDATQLPMENPSIQIQ